MTNMPMNTPMPRAVMPVTERTDDPPTVNHGALLFLL
jgi:hypothetical protein